MVSLYPKITIPKLNLAKKWVFSHSRFAQVARRLVFRGFFCRRNLLLPLIYTIKTRQIFKTRGRWHCQRKHTGGGQFWNLVSDRAAKQHLLLFFATKEATRILLWLRRRRHNQSCVANVNNGWWSSWVLGKCGRQILWVSGCHCHALGRPLTVLCTPNMRYIKQSFNHQPKHKKRW